MKLYRFLLLLLLPAFIFIKAGAHPAAQQDGSSCKQYHSFSHTDDALPHEELELAPMVQHSGRSFHFAVQNALLPGFASAKRCFYFPLTIQATCSNVQLFDNSTLVYNYPSHNFW